MPDFTPLYSPFGPALFMTIIPIIIVVALWVVAIKGLALWHAARESQKWWFIALLVINTLGILEVIYLVWFRPKNSSKEIPEMPADVSSSAQ
jgi:NADH:ubiquinone oxidoreductase subunit 6 (subunit J)